MLDASTHALVSLYFYPPLTLSLCISVSLCLSLSLSPLYLCVSLYLSVPLSSHFFNPLVKNRIFESKSKARFTLAKNKQFWLQFFAKLCRKFFQEKFFYVEFSHKSSFYHHLWSVFLYLYLNIVKILNLFIMLSYSTRFSFKSLSSLLGNVVLYLRSS